MDGKGVPVCSLCEEEFFLKLRASVRDNEELDLTNEVVHTSTVIKLARSESLVIRNGTIVGDCHSIFSMGTDRGYDNGPPALTLEGVTLLHTLTSEDKRAIGAAIFVMGKARIRVSNSVIDSKGGFGIWVKHGGRVHVDNTNFTSAGRSTMACFNLSRVTAINSTLMNAFVHGVCVRGDAKVSLSNCLIQAAGTRAAFVYQRGSLSLIECQITKTGNEKTPAIQAESIAPDDDAKLSLLRCSVYDNEGPSLVVNGEVEFVKEDNDFDALVEINPEVTSATVPRPWTELEKEMSGNTE